VYGSKETQSLFGLLWLHPITQKPSILLIHLTNTGARFGKWNSCDQIREPQYRSGSLDRGEHPSICLGIELTNAVPRCLCIPIRSPLVHARVQAFEIAQ
jgi:hypothetical protein